MIRLPREDNIDMILSLAHVYKDIGCSLFLGLIRSPAFNYTSIRLVLSIV